MGRPKSTEIIGNTYSFLKVIGRSEVVPRKYKCICICGKEFDTTKQRLENGSVKSCGCKKSELLSKAAFKHGYSVQIKNRSTYQSYIAMVQRCCNPMRASYKIYGGSGIFVENKSWLLPSPEGFLNFLEDMGHRPEGTSLDRVDSNKGYFKENCRWASRRLQAVNTNREKIANNTSKYRGVSLRKSNGKYMARIGNGLGGSEWLGEFLSEEAAAIAYNARAIELHGENAKLNNV